LFKQLFKTHLEALCIGPLVFRCGSVSKHGSEGSEFSTNRGGWPRILICGHCHILISYELVTMIAHFCANEQAGVLLLMMRATDFVTEEATDFGR
jgi:hypothetical protein